MAHSVSIRGTRRKEQRKEQQDSADIEFSHRLGRPTEFRRQRRTKNLVHELPKLVPKLDVSYGRMLLATLRIEVVRRRPRRA